MMAAFETDDRARSFSSGVHHKRSFLWLGMIYTALAVEWVFSG
jgi:hypothetical protein